MNHSSLYEKDFYAWIQHHIELLKQGRLAEIEVDILIEELESMGKRDKRELVSHFIILIAHLLKWQFQPHRPSNSWPNSIDEQRIQITKQPAKKVRYHFSQLVTMTGGEFFFAPSLVFLQNLTT